MSLEMLLHGIGTRATRDAATRWMEANDVSDMSVLGRDDKEKFVSDLGLKRAGAGLRTLRTRLGLTGEMDGAIPEQGVPAKYSAERLLADAFPAHHLAQPWWEIPWHKYQNILVTGPQRSGTTYFARALATYLGTAFLDEFDRACLLSQRGTRVQVDGRAGFGLDALFLKSNETVVAQRPKLAAQLTNVHRVPAAKLDAIVFVARYCPDVFRSQNSIMVDGEHDKITNRSLQDTGWTCKHGRKGEWASYWKDASLRPYFTPTDPICKIKQDVWVRFQQPLLASRTNAVTVSHDSIDNFTSTLAAAGLVRCSSEPGTQQRYDRKSTRSCNFTAEEQRPETLADEPLDCRASRCRADFCKVLPPRTATPTAPRPPTALAWLF